MPGVEFTASGKTLPNFDDDEEAGNILDFDKVLSPGDVNSSWNDDWRVRITGKFRAADLAGDMHTSAVIDDTAARPAWWESGRR